MSYDLAQLSYDLICIINELTGYRHLKGEYLRVSCEAMVNGYVNPEILAEAEREVGELRQSLDLLDLSPVSDIA